jgi:hypothetical protein
MLCNSSNKDFSEALKKACKSNSILNNTLKKYKKLTKILEQTKKDVLNNIDNNSYAEVAIVAFESKVFNELALNECFLLLAILTTKREDEENLMREISNDAGLSTLTYERIL